MRAVPTLYTFLQILTLVAFSTRLCSKQYRIRNHMGSYHVFPQSFYIHKKNILTLVARAPHLLNHLCTMRAEGHQSSRHLGPIDHLGAITPVEIIIQWNGQQCNRKQLWDAIQLEITLLCWYGQLHNAWNSVSILCNWIKQQFLSL